MRVDAEKDSSTVPTSCGSGRLGPGAASPSSGLASAAQWEAMSLAFPFAERSGARPCCSANWSVNS